MKPLQRIGTIASTAVLAFTSLLIIGFAAPALAASGSDTCTWTGATDFKFSTPTNWSNCSGAAPVAGDILAFSSLTPGSGGNSTTVSLTNDLGIAFSGLNLSQSSSTNNTTYYVSSLTLADGASINNTVPDDNNRTSLTIGTSSALAPVTAQGALTIAGDEPSASSYNISGVLTLASGSDFASPFTASGVVIQKSASLTLQASSANPTFSTPLTFGSGTGTTEPEMSFFSQYNGGHQATTYTVSSPITLLTDGYLNPDQTATINVTGSISGPSYAITKDPNSQGTLNINPSSNNSATATGTAAAQASAVTISDSQPTVGLDVPNLGVYTLDGSRGRVEVHPGGTLKGTGTAQNLYADSGSNVAPGHSPGTLTVTSQLNLGTGSIYQAELKDSTAGNYDQIVVGTAADTTGNDVTLGDTTGSPTLATSLYAGYSIKKGDTFEIINNLSKTPVKGTFSGLGEGATFTVNGYIFKISYVGGDGNDVVLTTVTVPAAPSTGLARITTHPFAALFGSAAAAAAILVVSRRLKPAPARATKR